MLNSGREIRPTKVTLAKVVVCFEGLLGAFLDQPIVVCQLVLIASRSNTNSSGFIGNGLKPCILPSGND